MHDRSPGRAGDRPGRDRAHLLHHGDRLRLVEQTTVVQGGRRTRPPGTKLFDFAGSTGLINGVPKTAGSFTFTVQVKDETRATDTETFTIQILPPEAPTITTEALSNGTVGEFYCCGNLFASGGVQPYTWSLVAGALPPGLELPRRENTISGTPTTAGTFTFTVRVTDDLGAISEKEFSITII